MFLNGKHFSVFEHIMIYRFVSVRCHAAASSAQEPQGETEGRRIQVR